MGHVNVPDGLKEIIQQNNEKAYPQIIMEQASYPYLFHLSDIRENLIAFLPVTKQMHVLERNAGCGALTGKLLSMALHVTDMLSSFRIKCIFSDTFFSIRFLADIRADGKLPCPLIGIF